MTGKNNILHMDQITMQFGGVVAVNGLTLDVNEHEIVALIGPNGAGKTTAFNCVTGIYQPTYGSVSFQGEVILADNAPSLCRRRNSPIPNAGSQNSGPDNKTRNCQNLPEHPAFWQSDGL